MTNKTHADGTFMQTYGENLIRGGIGYLLKLMKVAGELHEKIQHVESDPVGDLQTWEYIYNKFEYLMGQALSQPGHTDKERTVQEIIYAAFPESVITSTGVYSHEEKMYLHHVSVRIRYMQPPGVKGPVSNGSAMNHDLDIALMQATIRMLMEDFTRAIVYEVTR